MDSIIRMEKKDFYAKRNNTNNRLDTNITNMCGLLTKKIIKDNDLVSIDLNNSQFAILSYVLQTELTTEDFICFKRLSTSGELYDYLKEKFSLSSRKEAKTNCFELLFSGRKNPSKEKKDLKTEFPNVVAWIDNYKKEYGDKKFAIMLQQVESNMFIDKLYCILRDKIEFCLTKHDAFIVKREDYKVAANTMKEFFETIGMDCTLEVEGEDMKEKIKVRHSQDNMKEQKDEGSNLSSPKVTNDFDLNFGTNNLEQSEVPTEERLFVVNNYTKIMELLEAGMGSEVEEMIAHLDRDLFGKEFRDFRAKEMSM